LEQLNGENNMAKVSPVSIKYMIHANLLAEGALEKPDVIGAIFGQTEGLLGAELDMRELQKEGKIGRIEVEMNRKDKKTTAEIKIPTALDQSETTLIAAAVETIERVGPCDAQIEVERIEDVRGSKRDYIVDRAKKLMQEIQGSTDSRVISKEIKESTKTANIQEYGEEKLPCGDLSGKEIIVVEGRADVLSLLRAGVNNAIAMNGTKLPRSVQELTKNKEVTLFVDGDRGGELIIQNVTENAEIDYIVVAPDGKEVEELTGKEILMNLRKRIPANSFSFKNRRNFEEKKVEKLELSDENKAKLKELSSENQGSGKAIILDKDLEKINDVTVRGLSRALKGLDRDPAVIIIDGRVTSSIVDSAEEANVQVIVAKNFTTTDTSIQLLSL
jgi:DNA primase